jgi:hypothetical protein
MFKVASFDIGYNCIFDRPFILIFIAVIHTAYATIKMTGPRGVITLKSDQCDALTCENASLTHAGRFDEQEVQNLAAKLAKTHGGGGATSARTATPGPVAGDTLKMHVAKKGMAVTPTSTQHTINQLVADERKGTADKEIQTCPSDDDKKLRISTELEAK